MRVEWAAKPWRSLIVLGLVALAILLAGAFFVVQALGGFQQVMALIDQMKAQMVTLGEPVRDWVAQTGPWAPLTYVVSKALIFIFVPVAGYPLNVASGALFGLFWGVVLTATGDTLGACVLFLLSRRAGRPALARFLSEKRMSQVDRVLDIGLGGWRELLFARVIVPVPFNLVALAGGLAPETLRLRHFVLVTFPTALPKVFLVGVGAGVATGQLAPVVVGIIVPVIAVAALLTRRRVREALVRALRWRREEESRAKDGS